MRDPLGTRSRQSSREPVKNSFTPGVGEAFGGLVGDGLELVSCRNHVASAARTASSLLRTCHRGCHRDQSSLQPRVRTRRSLPGRRYSGVPVHAEFLSAAFEHYPAITSHGQGCHLQRVVPFEIACPIHHQVRGGNGTIASAAETMDHGVALRLRRRNRNDASSLTRAPATRHYCPRGRGLRCRS